MVREDGEMSAKQVDAPFLESMDNGEELFLVDRIIELCRVELLGFEGDRNGRFSSLFNGKLRTRCLCRRRRT